MCSYRLCDWEELEDPSDVALNQQGGMIGLKTEHGEIYRVYFDRREDKAYIVYGGSLPDESKEAVYKIINALGYEPVVVE